MSDIDEIKSRLNIVDIVGERVKLKKAGRNFKGLCPFHNEKTPSFIVSPDRQSFHCFGCGKGGSVFDFVMFTDQIDFSEALEMMADRAGVTLERRPADTPDAKIKQKIFEVNHLAGEYYHFLLTKHPVGNNAREYLKNRGVSDKSIKTFGLGYSANTWEGLNQFLKKKGYEEKLLETAGLVIRGGRGYYDRFRGRIIFTLRDHRGNTVGFSGRVLDPAAKEAKYINTSETPVYVKGKVLYGLDVTRDAIQKANEAVIMEGELDVISSFQAGIGNVVAIKGSAMTEDHARLLRRYAERLVFALDSDFAGDSAARRGIEIAEKSGFDMRVATLASGKDPDEAARENPVMLKKAIKEAVPMYDYFITSAVSRFEPHTAYGKKKITDELFPILAKIENPVVLGHYMREIARLLSLSDETVQDGLDRLKRSSVKRGVDRVLDTLQKPPDLTRLEKAELYVLSLLLQGKIAQYLARLRESASIKDFCYAPVRRILEHIERTAMFDAKKLADGLPDELLSIFDQAFMWDVSDFIENEERFDREWEKAVREVRKLHIKTNMEEKARKLKDLDSSDDSYDALQREFAEYTRKLAHLDKETQIR